jgi:hypothetical protein
MKRIAALCFLIFLSSYANIASAATNMAGIKTVGIMVAVGDRFEAAGL